MRSPLHLGGGLQIVELLEEFIELGQTLTQIVHTDRSVLVEIKTHPLVLHENLHIAVGLLHVLDYVVLSLNENLEQHAHVVACIVIEQDESFLELLHLVFD